MGLVHATEVARVRTYWVDSGRPTLAATLMFRVGQADETFATTGWLHLLEHLALHGLPRGTLDVNGSVTPLLTAFTMHGPPEQVVAALGVVTRRLAEPDLSDLVRERRVLAAEAATRGGPVQRAFGMRYGAAGPGLASFDDLALGRATEERLVELSRRAFSTGNAALALDGPPPESMELHLAPGAALPLTPAKGVERSRAVYAEGAGLVLTGVVRRTGASTLVAPVVEDALRRRLRDQEGAAYSPYSVCEPVDDDHALVVAGSDVSPSLGPTLLKTVVDLTDTLATSGPDVDALTDILGAMRQAYTDPYSVGYLSHRAAAQSLRGLPVEQLDDMLADLETYDIGAVRERLVEFRDSLIVGAPPETSPYSRLRIIEQPEHGTRAGGTRSVDWPADPSRIALTESMLTFGDARGHVQYPLHEVVGYLVWDDGSRRLVLADGWSFHVRPDGWRRGKGLVARLDALIDPDLHLPQPTETGAGPVVSIPLSRRWWFGMNRWFGGPVRAVLVLLVSLWCLYGMVQAVATADYGFLPVFPAFAVSVMWFFRVPQDR